MAENETNRETVVPFAHMPRPIRSYGGPADPVAIWAQARKELRIEGTCDEQQRFAVMERYNTLCQGIHGSDTVSLPKSDKSREASAGERLTTVMLGEVGKAALTGST